LWLTIILIVTTVLIILSVILSMYLRNYMLSSTETLLEEEISRAEEIVLSKKDTQDLNATLLREDNLIFYRDGQMLSQQSATDREIYSRIIEGDGAGNTFLLDDIERHDDMVRVSNLSALSDSAIAIIKYRDLEDINEYMDAV